MTDPAQDTPGDTENPTPSPDEAARIAAAMARPPVSPLRGLRTPEWVSDAVLEQAAAHFLSVFPREGVCYVTAEGAIPVENVAAHPEEAFDVLPEEWTAHGQVLAVLHSHPGGQPWPSGADLEYQRETGVPWGIAATEGRTVGGFCWFGDQLPIPSPYGRPFIHGIHDCYSLVRDLYRLGAPGLESLPDPNERIHEWPFPPMLLQEGFRDHLWWERGGDLYMDNFEKAGFFTLHTDRDRPDIRVGDVFFYKLGKTQVVNHAGVYIGGGLILHHVQGYTSQRAPLNLWGRNVQFWIRHRGP